MDHHRMMLFSKPPPEVEGIGGKKTTAGIIDKAGPG